MKIAPVGVALFHLDKQT